MFIKIPLNSFQIFIITTSNHNQIRKFATETIKINRILKDASFSHLKVVPFIFDRYLLSFHKLLIILIHINSKDIQAPLILKIFLV